ncbi:hypothetical protein BCR39DRAFT_560299 [Naematelia encephala]|uniref:NmrA-like domain-containing protein n=1 Tax=Naematelia encephala TaxID=71784 RepID=A0A1Y2AWD0_9TREE|nr:hypothetical protein BCR39DRAFT_560299 [Naematelia encephala]
MAPTVALYNHNGMVGSHLLRYLLAAHEAGLIILYILHRSGSNIDAIPQGIETRVVNFVKDSPNFDAELNRRAVQGINVFISAAAKADLVNQVAILEALSTSTELATFIPSEYGIYWTEEDYTHDNLKLAKFKDQLVDLAKSLNIPTTIIKVGSIPETTFGKVPDSGINVKENKVSFYGDARTRKTILASLEYIAAGVIELITTHKPSELANKIYQFIEYEPTGEEIIQALTVVHGRPPLIHINTEEELAEQYLKSIQEAIGAATKYKWGKVGFETPGERVTVKSYISIGLEAELKRFATK